MLNVGSSIRYSKLKLNPDKKINTVWFHSLQQNKNEKYASLHRKIILS